MMCYSLNIQFQCQRVKFANTHRVVLLSGDFGGELEYYNTEPLMSLIPANVYPYS